MPERGGCDHSGGRGISNSAQRQRGGFQPDRRSRVGVFDDAMVLKKFGKVPVDLTMLF